ncbi:MAG: type IV fimbrial biogenesis protein FimT [Porticoccus sp.]|jgi:type IV fimbrial biogenesis protein FimT
MNNYSLPQKNQQRGITLLELLVAASLFAILSTIAVSGLLALATNFNVMADRSSLLTLIKSARHTAITNNTYTTICRLKANECADFSSPLTAFTDTNNNQTLDTTETVIAKTTLDANATIYWNRHHRLRFGPNGRAGGFNGTLRYCADSKNFAVIISRVGRLRIQNAASCG